MINIAGYFSTLDQFFADISIEVGLQSLFDRFGAEK